MPVDWIELLRLWGPSAIPGVALLVLLRWVGDRVDKWADAAVKQAVTNEALTALIEHVHDRLQRIENDLKEINGRRN